MRQTLRLRGPLANDATGKTLHALLAGLLCCSLFLPGAIAVAALVATATAALVFLHRGCLRASAGLFLSGTWMIYTAVITLTGGIRSPAIALYLALPISAASLLDLTASIWTAAVCLGAALSLALMENSGLPLPRNLPETPLGIWAALLLATTISAASVARTLLTLKLALARSESAQAELRAAAQARCTALAGISHKLRAPLNAIPGFSNLVRDDTSIFAGHGQDLDIVSRSGEHLLTLIDEALDAARLSIEPEPHVGIQGQVLTLAPNQPAFRVLVVQDARESCTLLQRLLADAGFQVMIAANGFQAVDAFRTWRPHFIWMDLRLPVMGGAEAARKIRTLDGGRDVRIVAVTASAASHQRAELLSSGFDDFLRKPWRRHEIFDCLSRHLVLRYRYREARLQPPEALTMLPSDVPIAEAIRRVAEHNSQLGRILTLYSGRLAYAQILDALELEYGLAGGAS